MTAPKDISGSHIPTPPKGPNESASTDALSKLAPVPTTNTESFVQKYNQESVSEAVRMLSDVNKALSEKIGEPSKQTELKALEKDLERANTALKETVKQADAARTAEPPVKTGPSPEELMAKALVKMQAEDKAQADLLRRLNDQFKQEQQRQTDERRQTQAQARMQRRIGRQSKAASLPPAAQKDIGKLTDHFKSLDKKISTLQSAIQSGKLSPAEAQKQVQQLAAETKSALSKTSTTLENLQTPPARSPAASIASLPGTREQIGALIQLVSTATPGTLPKGVASATQQLAKGLQAIDQQIAQITAGIESGQIKTKDALPMLNALGAQAQALEAKASALTDSLPPLAQASMRTTANIELPSIAGLPKEAQALATNITQQASIAQKLVQTTQEASLAPMPEGKQSAPKTPKTMAALSSKLDSLQKQTQATLNALTNPNISAQDRKSLTAELQKLQGEYQQLQADTKQAYRELPQTQSPLPEGVRKELQELLKSTEGLLQEFKKAKGSADAKNTGPLQQKSAQLNKRLDSLKDRLHFQEDLKKGAEKAAEYVGSVLSHLAATAGAQTNPIAATTQPTPVMNSQKIELFNMIRELMVTDPTVSKKDALEIKLTNTTFAEKVLVEKNGNQLNIKVQLSETGREQMKNISQEQLTQTLSKNLNQGDTAKNFSRVDVSFTGGKPGEKGLGEQDAGGQESEGRETIELYMTHKAEEES